MGCFEVTSREVRNKANSLQELNSQFRSQSSELETQEGALVAMWEGEAKNAFHKAFTHDKEQMESFSQLIDRYVQALLDIAQRYEEAERRAYELAQARNY